MPLVTLTVRDTTDRAWRRQILDAVHAALVRIGVPADDRFQRVIALDGDSLIVDPAYPDVAGRRGEQFALVEILWSAGRSVKVKRQMLAALAEGLAAADIDAEQVMLVFKETTWENWAFAGTRLLHA